LTQQTNANEQSYAQLKERVTSLRDQVEKIEENKKEVEKNVQSEMIRI
jgi:septation ring formation regulator EzrA